jgi:hypothetical protein
VTSSCIGVGTENLLEIWVGDGIRRPSSALVKPVAFSTKGTHRLNEVRIKMRQWRIKSAHLFLQVLSDCLQINLGGDTERPKDGLESPMPDSWRSAGV